ncbi:hypothetical protein [Hugenholtzia roseola]|uniref:hypothetical protein n=1 Tax=Hugenholtzia roseola TaxID=1002 RepID=UPI00041059E3|nr:hypothetical protein [Hugenholtzia roseola]
MRLLSLLFIWVASAFFFFSDIMLPSSLLLAQGEESNFIKLKINRGSRYTRTPIVTLQLVAPNAAKMQISNYADFRDANWIGYQSKVYGWSLLKTEGMQSVFARFQDAKGTYVGMQSAHIFLDKTAPQNTKIEIDVPNKVLNDTTQRVTLKFSWTQEEEERYYVMVSNHRSFYRQRWQVVQDTISDWALSGTLDGEYFVFAKFRDRAGNISELISDKVGLDTQAPVRYGIVIDGNVPFTTNKKGEVSLVLTAIGATEMKVSNQADFKGAEWQPYQRNLKWLLTEGEGEKKVYAKFRDNAKNETPPTSAMIVKDTEAPKNLSLIINEGETTTRHIDGIVELSIKAEEASLMMISNFADFRNARWQPYEELISDWHLTGENGKKTVYIKFKDESENTSEPISAEIILIR